MFECCKDDIQSLWEKANFDPQPTKNPKIGYNSACVRYYCEIFAPIGGFSRVGHQMLPITFSFD